MKSVTIEMEDELYEILDDISSSTEIKIPMLIKTIIIHELTTIASININDIDEVIKNEMNNKKIEIENVSYIQ